MRNLGGKGKSNDPNPFCLAFWGKIDADIVNRGS
jgi:hypothetical protein